jgi:hypothetical protein
MYQPPHQRPTAHHRPRRGNRLLARQLVRGHRTPTGLPRPHIPAQWENPTIHPRAGHPLAPYLLHQYATANDPCFHRRILRQVQTLAWGSPPLRVRQTPPDGTPQCNRMPALRRRTRTTPPTISHIFGSKPGGAALGAFIAASQACVRSRRNDPPPENNG